MEDKKRGVKLVLLFFVMALILSLAITFLFLKEKTQTRQIIEESSPPFKVDQILLKVLIKEDESMVRPINIMDISNYDLYIEIDTQSLYDTVSVSDNRFALKTGQTKTVYLNFTSFIKEKGIKQEPGIYVGNLLIKSDSDMAKIPIITEIETKEILFDANVEISIEQKQIEQGNYLNAHVTLFNLKKIGLTNLNIEYFIKDAFGNTVITETESITIETQTSFVKTMYIPANLNPGEYVFGTVVRYGSSVGTSTVLFEVAKPPIKEKNLIDYYRNNELFFLILLIILVMIISFIGSHLSFLAGLFVHSKSISLKEKPPKVRVKEKEEKKLVKKEIKHKELKHKKLFLVLLYLIVISFIIACLFYKNIVTLEMAGYLWNLIINWLKNIVIKDYAIKVLSFVKDYYSYIITFLVGIIFVLLIYSKRKSLAKFFEELTEGIKNASKNEKIVISLLLAIILLIILFFVLFNCGILSAGQFSTLFSNTVVKVSEFGKIVADKSSDLWDNTKALLSSAYKNSLNWLKNVGEKIKPYAKDIWRTILYYTPPQRKYFYPMLSVIVIVALTIIAKKIHIFKRLKAKSNMGGKERGRRLARKDVKAKKVIRKEEVGIFKNFKRLPLKRKSVILFILIMLLLMVIATILIELGMLTIE